MWCYINDNNSQQLKNTAKVEEKSEEKIISREIISAVATIDDDLVKKQNKQIINNCFARADKKEKNFFESNWSKLNDYALDSEFGAAACYISDGTIRAVGVGEVIISFGYESMVNRGFNLLEKVQKLLEKIYNKHYDIALVTDEEWEQEKADFIANKNNKDAYQYVPLEKVEKQEVKYMENDDSITSQAIELFGEDMISVN